MNTPNIFVRFIYAFALFFRFVFSQEFATRVWTTWHSAALPPAPEPPKQIEPASRPAAPPPPKPAPSQAPALQLLGILQREGRLVDFLQEDISNFPDSDVGAAARVVHEGCRKALSDYITLEPLRTDGEGARVVIDRGFDPVAIRLTGNVTGEPPFRGALRHHGWRASSVRLPDPPSEPEATIVAPAEVEL